MKIENQTTGEVISAVSNIKDTFYDFTSFEKLKKGKFSFKVKATSVLPKTNSLRAGYENVYFFEIDLPKIENFKIPEHEEYYGY